MRASATAAPYASHGPASLSRCRLGKRSKKGRSSPSVGTTSAAAQGSGIDISPCKLLHNADDVTAFTGWLWRASSRAARRVAIFSTWGDDETPRKERDGGAV